MNIPVMLAQFTVVSNANQAINRRLRVSAGLPAGGFPPAKDGFLSSLCLFMLSILAAIFLSGLVVVAIMFIAIPSKRVDTAKEMYHVILNVDTTNSLQRSK